MVTQQFDEMLYTAIFGVWKGEERNVRLWNPYVWTLFVEFWASLGIYGLASVINEYNTRIILYVSVIIFCWTGFMNEFPDICYDRNI